MRVTAVNSVLTVAWQDGMIRAIDNTCINDRAFDRAIPAVIVLRAQECLVDCSIDKLCSICIVLCGEYIVQGVCHTLKPDSIMELYFFCKTVDCGFARIINN